MNERGAEIEIDAPTEVVGPVLTDLCIRVFQLRPDNRNGACRRSVLTQTFRDEEEACDELGT